MKMNMNMMRKMKKVLSLKKNNYNTLKASNVCLINSKIMKIPIKSGKLMLCKEKICNHIMNDTIIKYDIIKIL
jgi:hypothetical protein